MIKQIQKRNGTFVLFDRARIENAIQKASIAVGKDLSGTLLISITDQVIADLETTTKPIHVEQVQDIVEQKLFQSELFVIAKAYILYRKEHEQLR